MACNMQTEWLRQGSRKGRKTREGRGFQRGGGGVRSMGALETVVPLEEIRWQGSKRWRAALDFGDDGLPWRPVRRESSSGVLVQDA